MSCFWQAVTRKIAALKNHDPSTVIRALQSVNCLTKDVRWDQEVLSAKLLEENFEWVKEYNPLQYSNGHDTSICDPFLLLICQVYCVNLVHVYTGPNFEGGRQRGQVKTTHKYEHPKATSTVHFQSSVGHFT